ncbi:thioesterase II family protein [Streptomyces sp. NPDC057638]|uniref:thioesterase II family protein n=1 Tax=Streptomyces sp. NPDC057638 TaxID=3346190 RepID=UPI00367F5B70
MTNPAAPHGTTGRWLIRRVPRPDAPLRLYCFPHSGGSPGEYLRWSESLEEIEVWGVQAPGRGSRIAERPLTTLTELVDGLLAATAFVPPFAFFGHSLGALAAYETTRALAARGLPGPEFLVASACPAPDRPRSGPFVHDLSDKDLFDVIQRRYGGLPPELAADPALVELVMPYYRADFAMFETYRHRPGPEPELPLWVVGGDQDIPGELLGHWRPRTTGPFELRTLPGGHFYLRDEEARAGLLRLITEAARKAPRPPWPTHPQH